MRSPRLLLVVSCSLAAVVVSGATNELRWDSLPALPPAPGQTRQAGLASPFVGLHHGALLVAGGANFPERMPWEGGAKVWWDDILVLEESADGRASWIVDRSFKLPRPLGYGISVTTPDGVVCVGGSDAERCFAEVFLLRWDAGARMVGRTALPSLPRPLANMAGALVGTTVLVAGGQHELKGAVPSAVFWALDLSRRGKGSDFKWNELPSWPGPPRVLPVAAAQDGQFFLFSGRVPEPGRPTQILSDAYAFDPRSRAWRKLAAVGGGTGVSVMAGTAAPVGRDEVWVFGGDRGELFRELEAHDLAIEDLRRKVAAATSVAKDSLAREIERRVAAKRRIYENHPGFGREVFAYTVASNRWRVVGQSPVAPQVTTSAVKWDGAVVIPSGEVRPGVRTAEIVRVRSAAAP